MLRGRGGRISLFWVVWNAATPVVLASCCPLNGRRQEALEAANVENAELAIGAEAMRFAGNAVHT